MLNERARARESSFEWLPAQIFAPRCVALLCVALCYFALETQRNATQRNTTQRVRKVRAGCEWARRRSMAAAAANELRIGVRTESQLSAKRAHRLRARAVAQSIVARAQPTTSDARAHTHSSHAFCRSRATPPRARRGPDESGERPMRKSICHWRRVASRRAPTSLGSLVLPRAHYRRKRLSGVALSRARRR